MKYEADWKDKGVEYSVDLDYFIDHYYQKQTWDSPEESSTTAKIEKIRRCVIKDSGKTYIVSTPEALPDKYYEAICKVLEERTL